MTIIIFIIVLAVLIFVHELGHFLVAKKSGIRVDEFAIGFPPKIYSKKIGETNYVLNLVPFGGYVKIFGEDPNDESITGMDSKRSFVNKSALTKILVLIAGVTANIILAWILFSISFMSGMTAGVASVNADYIQNKQVIVTDVLKDSPAEKAGFMAGDQILSQETVEDVQGIIKESLGKEIAFTVKRLSEELILNVTPKNGIIGTGYGIGISMDMVGTVKLPVYLAIWEGLKLTYNLLIAIVVGLYQFFFSILQGTADFTSISGPVGIANLVGEARTLGFVYLMSFTAFISLNLAVLNLLPFPALDGGRILFVIIESIKRSPIKPVVANTINAVGFALLILLMVIVTFKDIVKLF